MATYIFAPAGAQQLRNSFLKLAVEFIGSQQPGRGSYWAKGKRYIKEKTHCSGRAIKRACVVKNKVINNDYQEYGIDVYYFHKDYSAEIVCTILNYLVLHNSDPDIPSVFYNLNFHVLLDRTYSHRISQVKWVSIQNYKGQGEEARKIYHDLSTLG